MLSQYQHATQYSQMEQGFKQPTDTDVILLGLGKPHDPTFESKDGKLDTPLMDI